MTGVPPIDISLAESEKTASEFLKIAMILCARSNVSSLHCRNLLACD